MDKSGIKRTTAPERVLVACVGRSPAVITETLQKLYEEHSSTVTPNRIIVFTTSIGRAKVDEDFRNALALLCKQHRMKVPVLDLADIKIPRRSNGELLDDIRNAEDHILFANLVAREIRALTTAGNVSIHASIAGGRKTMGGVLQTVMAMFGRSQDELSHVLLDPPEAEEASNFYFRSKAHDLLRDSAGSSVRAEVNGKLRQIYSDGVTVNLVKLAMPPLRGSLTDPAFLDPDYQLDFAELERVWRALGDPPSLILHPDRREVEIVGFAKVPLQEAEYAWYQLLVEARLGTIPGRDKSGRQEPDAFKYAIALSDLAPLDDIPDRQLAPSQLFGPCGTRYVEIHSEIGGYDSRDLILGRDPEEDKLDDDSEVQVDRSGIIKKLSKKIAPQNRAINRKLEKHLRFVTLAKFYAITNVGVDVAAYSIPLDASRMSIAAD